MRVQLAAVTMAGCIFGCEVAPDRARAIDPQHAPGTVEYSVIEPVISTESELLGYPSDLAVASDGRIWIADALSNRILSARADGSDPRIFGREGEGPGEFRGPVALTVHDGVVRVLESLGGRVQDLDTAGQALAVHALPRSVQGQVALSADTHVGLPMHGYDSALLLIYKLGDTVPPVSLGPPVTQAPAIWDFTAIREEIRQGSMPSAFRNHVIPAPGASGDWFLVIQTESEVRKYSSGGELEWREQFEFPELESARAEFFRRNNEEPNPAKLTAPLLIRDARCVGDELWLMPMPVAFAPVTIYALDQDTGRVLRRLIINTAQPPSRFAVDEERGRLYLLLGESASVVAVELR